MVGIRDFPDSKRMTMKRFSPSQIYTVASRSGYVRYEALQYSRSGYVRCRPYNIYQTYRVPGGFARQCNPSNLGGGGTLSYKLFPSDVVLSDKDAAWL